MNADRMKIEIRRRLESLLFEDVEVGLGAAASSAKDHAAAYEAIERTVRGVLPNDQFGRGDAATISSSEVRDLDGTAISKLVALAEKHGETFFSEGLLGYAVSMLDLRAKPRADDFVEELTAKLHEILDAHATGGKSH